MSDGEDVDIAERDRDVGEGPYQESVAGKSQPQVGHLLGNYTRHER